MAATVQQTVSTPLVAIAASADQGTREMATFAQISMNVSPILVLRMLTASILREAMSATALLGTQAMGLYVKMSLIQKNRELVGEAQKWD
jgi:hypothetical protein